MKVMLHPTMPLHRPRNPGRPDAGLPFTGKPPVRFSGTDRENVDHYIVRTVFDFKEVHSTGYIDALTTIKSRKLQKHIRDLALALKSVDKTSDLIDGLGPMSPLVIPIFIVGGAFIKRKFSVRRAVHLLQTLPHEQLKYEWARNLIDSDHYDYKTGFRMMGARTIPSISNPQQRDELIAKICRHNTVKIRKYGAGLVPLISNKSIQDELIQKLSMDSESSVRSRLASALKNPSVTQLNPLDMEDTETLDDLPSVTVMVADAQQQKQRQEIDQLAAELESRLKRYYQDNTMVRQSLLAQYGDEKHFPTAETFKKHFYQLAKGHLKSKQGWIPKLTGSAPNELAVLELTRGMLEMAHKTNAFILPQNVDQYMTQLEKIQTQRKALETDLDKARKVVTQQALFCAQADDDYKTQQAKVTQLTRQLEDARTQKQEATAASLTVRLHDEQNHLRETEKRKTTFENAYALAQAKVEALSSQMDNLYRDVGYAIQYGLMTNSKEELAALLNKNADLLHNRPMQQILDQAEDQKYSLLADQERETTAPPEQTRTKEVKAS